MVCMGLTVGDLKYNLNHRPTDRDTYCKLFSALQEGSKNITTLSSETGLSPPVIRGKITEMEEARIVSHLEVRDGGRSENMIYLRDNSQAKEMATFLEPFLIQMRKIE